MNIIDLLKRTWLVTLLGGNRPVEIWKHIGSPSYRRAIQDLHSGLASAIRRRAWGGRSSLYFHNPRHDLCCMHVKGRLPRYIERYPPGYRVIHVTDETPNWCQDIKQIREEWWCAPDEDVNADDWERRYLGVWESARGV